MSWWVGIPTAIPSHDASPSTRFDRVMLSLVIIILGVVLLLMVMGSPLLDLLGLSAVFY